eukprot:3872340-Rhodomonas_salina.7
MPTGGEGNCENKGAVRPKMCAAQSEIKYKTLKPGVQSHKQGEGNLGSDSPEAVHGPVLPPWYHTAVD